MNNSKTLTQLRQAIAKLDQYEKLALATFLTENANPMLGTVLADSMGNPEHELTKACELGAQFSNSAKLFFAIELLELQIDRYEFDEGNYEGEEYFASDRPALAGNEESNGHIFYHGSDGEDFEP